jgi:hypothetical protein
VYIEDTMSKEEAANKLLESAPMALTLMQMKELYNIVSIREDGDEYWNDNPFTVFIEERENLSEDAPSEGCGWKDLEERISLLPKNICKRCSLWYCGACHNTCTSEWGNPCPMMK